MDHSVGYQVRIRVAGRVPHAWSDVFADLALTDGPDGTTLLRGEVSDQAALHGLLDAIRDLGLVLISAETVATTPATTPIGGLPCRS